MYAINHTPTIDLTKSETGCCTLIEPTEWDKQTFTFENKPFVKVRTNSIMHIPLNMSGVMRKAQEEIAEFDAADNEWLVLSQDVSPWHADHYIAVKDEVPDMENGRLTGTFVTRVFEGKYSEIPKWYEQLRDYAKSLGRKSLNTYFFYTVCPKCARTYGKNYVVGFEQVS